MQIEAWVILHFLGSMTEKPASAYGRGAERQRGGEGAR